MSEFTNNKINRKIIINFFEDLRDNDIFENLEPSEPFIIKELAQKSYQILDAEKKLKYFILEYDENYIVKIGVKYYFFDLNEKIIYDFNGNLKEWTINKNKSYQNNKNSKFQEIWKLLEEIEDSYNWVNNEEKIFLKKQEFEAIKTKKIKKNQTNLITSNIFFADNGDDQYIVLSVKHGHALAKFFSKDIEDNIYFHTAADGPLKDELYLGLENTENYPLEDIEVIAKINMRKQMFVYNKNQNLQPDINDVIIILNLLKTRTSNDTALEEDDDEDLNQSKDEAFKITYDFDFVNEDGTVELELEPDTIENIIDEEDEDDNFETEDKKSEDLNIENALIKKSINSYKPKININLENYDFDLFLFLYEYHNSNLVLQADKLNNYHRMKDYENKLTPLMKELKNILKINKIKKIEFKINEKYEIIKLNANDPLFAEKNYKTKINTILGLIIKAYDHTYLQSAIHAKHLQI